jgi:hypothetical protein
MRTKAHEPRLSSSSRGLQGGFALYAMRPDGSHLKLLIALASLKPRLTDWGPRATHGGNH